MFVFASFAKSMQITVQILFLLLAIKQKRAVELFYPILIEIADVLKIQLFSIENGTKNFLVHICFNLPN